VSAKPDASPTQHQFIADVLAETESVTGEIHAQRETALTAWQAQLRQFRLLSEEANQLTPSAFVRRVHELLPELHQAAMAAVVYAYSTSPGTADVKTHDNQGGRVVS
jgi:hypothetical protein